VLVVGDHADEGVLSGGGSAPVTPPGSIVLPDSVGTRALIYHPSSLVRALRDLPPDVQVEHVPDLALAAVLTGAAEPTGRLPVTFPRDTAQLPRPHLHGSAAVTSPAAAPLTGHFAENYNIEGADVGYRWFSREGLDPLFWFGFGLAYTSFDFGNLSVSVESKVVRVSVDVTNSGVRAGVAVPQFYAGHPSGTSRLVGWERLELGPGESGNASAVVDRRLLSRWDADSHEWQVASGPLVFSAGASAGDRALEVNIELPG
jgi:beta-glucosidase